MHEKWMQLAIDNALKAWGHTSPNPHVGAVIVKDGEVIADGWHKKAGTHHAEKDAIAKAREAGREDELYGSTIYVTLEPCCTYGRTEPCTEWIMEAGISKVVYGCTDTNPEHAGRGFNYLLQAGVEIEGPILEEECLEINRFFFKWIDEQKPYVILKMAQTLDGKIATESGQSQWITGPEARFEVQKLRQGCDAIMVGAETIRQDNPSLNVREIENPRHPLPFIWTRNKLEGDYKVLSQDNKAEFCHAQSEEEWNAFLEEIGSREITSLLLEGGGWLASSALSAGIVDEVQFFIAPKILGGESSRSSVSGPNPLSLDEAIDLDSVKTKVCGKDILVIAKPKYK
ncbi:bifunctional diaminohydroxyphosphoribosylaminopyrimidine deaminase/5-amino-6-(5-phosphoribosylamino)uracil reductase RibD [Lentisphaera marina]|uniref:bifunctional diaminohydroxyphosphoribosylaminopyrimidine deaminase/5-amino-6-(5-phosphoribosylamino)uracil reductase RibD n=1 Tax=Lentisphaera marina TaxID=1111041 RepID=UPI0023665246|nr:bifunctional diaminohydroxyphosphoribosylaminopyrimidine deaminase/5-amino-6-(5-phosphoribosylamino)uracil reductase RibD [Lentisphaera marina]MDD7985541.1 bifunctional diaminohydroxyphosphoribosylaminopyrimidine deaminase/5-amino-6-(5-phosphoribosylamino)uracil reductase RibD [Lentisphaera marina]